MRGITCKNLFEWFALGFVPYCNTFGKDSLLATLTRLGKIYTEKDKNRFQVGKPCGFFRGTCRSNVPPILIRKICVCQKKAVPLQGVRMLTV